MGKIKIGIIGIGNCASALIQGIEYYKQNPNTIGLMNKTIGRYKPEDIEVVCAYDIDYRKVGKPLHKAIFANPNCTQKLDVDLPESKVIVKMGIILDGYPEHMNNFNSRYTFVLSTEKEPEPHDIIKHIINTGCNILINYCPVGSKKAVEEYTSIALKARVGYINCMPIFIASNNYWANLFKNQNIPIIGDDIKSQVGATIIHRTLTKLLEDRGAEIKNAYQLNVGGNTDFLNMLDYTRTKTKKISKTDAVNSISKKSMSTENLHIGPSDWVPWLKDNKICFLRIEANIFGNVPINLEMRLSVEDSPNSAGVVIDAIRCCKLALDNNLGGALIAPSAYFMKHPPNQYPDNKAKKMVKDFIKTYGNIIYLNGL